MEMEDTTFTLNLPESSDSNGASPNRNVSFDKSYAPTPAPRNIALQALNVYLESGNVGPIRGQLLTSPDECASSTRRYYKRKTKEAFDLVLHDIAPGHESELMQLTIHQDVTSDSDSDLENKLLQCYENAESSNTKRQILSILCRGRTKEQLQALIPGLTIYRIDKARSHENTVGAGQPPEIVEIRRNRMDDEKIDHFLDFVSRPEFVQDVAYDTRNIKLSHGEKLEIPNVIRTVVVSRIIELYMAYCDETGFIPLGRTSLYSIIQVCAASRQKSVAGLDNVAAEASEAFANLHTVVASFGELGASRTLTDDLKMKLTAAVKYMKTDFKLNLELKSRCIHHCITFALSDGSLCDDHEHDSSCQRCMEMESVLDRIEKLVKGDTLNFSYPQQCEEMLHDVVSANTKISQLRSHIVRAKNQERSKTDIIDQLKQNEAHITMDWAMKFLPMKFRESQQEWYGKKGISWHITAAVTRGENEELQIHCFVHVIEQCSQNWFAVLSVLEASLLELKQRIVEITTVYLRSDNAGCYHCAPLLLSLPSLGKRIGVTISRYDFSEAQSGKDLCDRKIAPMKSHLHRYANQGNDVVSAQQMWEGLDSYGGVRGCYAAVLKLDEESMVDRIKWPGITKYNDFVFDKEYVTVWQSYKIGEGKRVLYSELIKETEEIQGDTNSQVGRYTTPKTRTGLISSNVQSVEISCVDAACIKTFSSQDQLTRHISHGKHVYKPENETVLDSVKRRWASKFTEAREDSALSVTGTASLVSTSDLSLSAGWAVKVARASRRFSDGVKDFLLECFMKGVQTGKKENPNNVCKVMKKKFQKEDWLTTKQIASYFSRLAAMQRSGKPLLKSSVPESESVDAEEEAVIEVTNRRKLRSRITKECEL